MAWVLLILAGVGEVVGVLGLNRLNEKRSAGALALLIGGFVSSFILLTTSLQSLSMGTAYAIWTGIGTIGATLIGMAFFGESRDGRRIFFLVLVLAAAIGLKLVE
ncbi:multidrug efflux SMR transporter [Cohnella sp. AR92]|uniref:DMT family transporter n=1 Tax=Cohnella sp. AR92 TaxID=648716 RepID=UPI000F8CD1D1|nr:SMR family transporter [Cohnella sp. AR92]RUS43099.1 QacE family quaternary ammonium compound efflux SMR transporter [Cohnella sp. AR92]